VIANPRNLEKLQSPAENFRNRVKSFQLHPVKISSLSKNTVDIPMSDLGLMLWDAITKLLRNEK
jgi:hypothetical protein